MKNIIRTHAFVLLALIAAAALVPSPVAAQPPGANYDEAKVGTYTLPDPLVCADGARVTDARTWLLRTGWRRHGLLSVYEMPATA